MASHEAVPSNYHSCNETQHPAGVMVAASCARNDEEQPLLAKAAAVDTVQVGAPQKILGIVCILLLGIAKWTIPIRIHLLIFVL